MGQGIKVAPLPLRQEEERSGAFGKYCDGNVRKLNALMSDGSTSQQCHLPTQRLSCFSILDITGTYKILLKANLSINSSSS